MERTKFESAIHTQETPKPVNSKCQNTYLQTHLQKILRIRLTDGKVFSAKLLAFDTYTILCEGSAGKILVNKAAIAYIAENSE